MDMQNECRGDAEDGSNLAAEMAFVAGDRGAGLVIAGLGQAEQTFMLDGLEIRASLRTDTPRPGIWTLSLKLDPQQPVRFRVEWLIPEDAQNAAMLLNGGLLISPFAAGWPADGPVVPSPACGHQTPVSTLHPGQFQTVNFMWQAGDELTLHLIMPAG